MERPSPRWCPSPGPDQLAVVRDPPRRRRRVPERRRCSRRLSRRSCSGGCPATWCPPTSRCLDALPTMPSGKVDRKRSCPRRQAAGHARAATAPWSRPTVTLEERSRAVWAEAFGLEPAELSVEARLLHRPRRALAARGDGRVAAAGARGGRAARRCATCTATRPCGAWPLTSRPAAASATGADAPAPRPAPPRHGSRPDRGWPASGQALVLYR